MDKCKECEAYLPIMALTKCRCGKWWLRYNTDLPIVSLSNEQAHEIITQYKLGLDDIG